MWYCMSREIMSSCTYSSMIVASSCYSLQVNVVMDTSTHPVRNILRQINLNVLNFIVVLKLYECCGVSMRLFCARMNHSVANICFIVSDELIGWEMLNNLRSYYWVCCEKLISCAIRNKTDRGLLEKARPFILFISPHSEWMYAMNNSPLFLIYCVRITNSCSYCLIFCLEDAGKLHK